MTGAQEFPLDDGTTVRFLISGAGDGRPALEEDNFPDGLGPIAPVARRGEAVAAVAADMLRNTLKPLSPLVQAVHDAVNAVPTPTEVAVTFGVQLGQDLKLGIVNGSGQAHLTATATWKPVCDGLVECKPTAFIEPFSATLVTVCDLHSGGAAVLELQDDEGGSGDPGDGRRIEADPAQGLEGDLQKGVRTLRHAVHAPDHRVERLVFFGEFAAFGLS